MGKSFRLSSEQAEEILAKNIKYIKKTVKKKINIYDPLDYKTAFIGFLKWIEDEELKVIRELPANRNIEAYLNDLIKDFLIENAYYALEERYIKKRIMNKLGILDSNDIRFLEIIDYIIERIEKDKLKKLKKFEEKSKFKTFLSTVVSRLLTDYWRDQYKIKDHVTKYETDFEATFDQPVDDPFNRLTQVEDEKLKNKAAEILPKILDELDFKEKLAIKLKYEKEMKISAIARTLGRTRFKTEQFIKQIEIKLSMEISSEIKRRQR